MGVVVGASVGDTLGTEDGWTVGFDVGDLAPT